MKSLIVSALALGTAIAQSQYYIGNYTALGQVVVLPYPLDVCVSTGLGYPYAIFTCNATTSMVTAEMFLSSDETCEEAATTSTFAAGMVPGLPGYAHCTGLENYIVIDQYLGTCSNWKLGEKGTATTIVAAGACSIYSANTTTGIYIYSQSTCTAYGQTTYAHLNDPTCAEASIIQAVASPASCHYYATEGTTKVYSAMRECVLDDMPQRCADPILTYTADVAFFDLEDVPNFWDVYAEIFPYATVSTWNLTNATQTPEIIQLALGFCSIWEYSYSIANVKNLGMETLEEVDADAVCWACMSCSNSTLCNKNEYCNMSPQCANLTIMSSSTNLMSSTNTPTSSTKKSAAAIYVGFFTLIALLLSFVL